MNIDLRKDTHQMLATWIIAIVLFWILILETESQSIEVIRTIVWSLFLLVLPGYWLTRAFFEDNEIDVLERVALSFALSISVIPLLVFYLNLAWLGISAIMVRAVVMATILLTRARTYYRTNKNDTIVS